jgi:hypothetical protein
MAPASDDVFAEPKEPPPEACVNCGSKDFSTRTKMPVCEPCRMGLVRYPFPGWVKLCAGVVCLMVVVSLALSRERVQEAFLLSRAKRMHQQQRWEDAYRLYHQVVVSHNDTDTLLAYAEAAVDSGHYEDAARTMETLGGRRAQRHQVARADAISGRLRSALPVPPSMLLSPVPPFAMPPHVPPTIAPFEAPAEIPSQFQFFR